MANVVKIAASLAPFCLLACGGESVSIPGDETFDLECPGPLAHTLKVENFYVIGHRGDAGTEIENTIPAFQAGIADGATGVELDLCLTKDGYVVVSHDWDPDTVIARVRQAGKEPGVKYRPDVPGMGSEWRKPVDELTLAEFREHYGFATKGGEHVDAYIPTFDEFVAWARSEPRLRMVLLDIKVPKDKAELTEPLIQKMEAILHAGEMHFDRVYMTPYKPVWEAIDPLVEDAGLSYDADPGFVIASEGDCSSASSQHALDRGGGYATSVHPASWFHEDWKRLKKLVTCDLEARDSTQGLVDKVFVATIDEGDKMSCLMQMGVNGLVTDDPAKLISLAVSDEKTIAGF